MITRILLLSEGNKISGPSTWKNGLLKNIHYNNLEINEIDITKINSIKKLFDIKNYTIVHGYNISGNSLLFILLAKLLNKKIIFTLHGNYFQEMSSKKGIKKIFWIPFHQYSLSLANRVTVPSNYLLEIIKKKNSSIKNKTIVIPNAIDACAKCMTTKEIKLNSPIKVITITNFNIDEKIKGLIPLIEAINKYNLKNKDDPVKLSIIGGGTQLQFFKEKYNNEFVNFFGRQKHVDNLLEESDIMIHSTFLESFGYIILEAMKHNLPVISVKVGGIPEILPEYTLAIPNTKSIYEKFNQLINTPENLNKLMKRNKIILNRYLWRNISKNWQTLYKEINR